MLRLTSIHHADRGVTLVVEGRIEGEWSAFLARECAALIDGGLRVCLDLSGVRDADPGGIDCVRRLVRGSVTLVRCAPLIQELLQDGSNEPEDGTPMRRRGTRRRTG